MSPVIGSGTNGQHSIPSGSTYYYDLATIPPHLIDREISRQEKTLSTFRTKRNAYFSKVRIPNEMLSEIFRHCAIEDYYHDSKRCGVKRPILLTLTSVCRLWRHAALDCAGIWSYIHTMSPRWTEEFLIRSRMIPLKIRIKGSTRTADVVRKSLEKVMNHVERIQVLNLDIPDIPGFSLGRLLHAPRLQTLKIWVNPPAVTSVVFFGATIPALRILRLKGCSVPWYNFGSNGLTTLSLEGLPIHFQPDVEEFLEIISCMQNLTQLDLDHSLPGSQTFIHSAAFNTFQKVQLPKLSRLDIEATLPTVIAFLSCVNVPLGAEVRLKCCSRDFPFHDGDDSDDTLLPSLLAQRFTVSEDRTLPSPTIRSLVVEFTGLGPRLTFSTSERDCDSCVDKTDMWDCNIPLQVLLDYSESDVDLDQIINTTCSAVPLTHVRSVHIVQLPLDSVFWKRTLTRLPELRYLKLSESRMPALAHALLADPHDLVGGDDGERDEDEAQNRMFAPALEELELYRITFARRRYEYDLGPLITDLRSLKRALHLRKGPEIKVTLIECDQITLPDDGYISEEI